MFLNISIEKGDNKEEIIKALIKQNPEKKLFRRRRFVESKNKNTCRNTMKDNWILLVRPNKVK